MHCHGSGMGDLVFSKSPRPQPIGPVIITKPEEGIGCSFPGRLWTSHFPVEKDIPISVARREGVLIGYLHPAEGNLWKLLYNTMNPMIQLYWKHAHEYSARHSLTSAEYYSWEKFIEDHDPRFCYYPMEYHLTVELSREDLRETTDEQEYAKCNEYRLNELPKCELFRRTPSYGTVEGNQGQMGILLHP